MALDIKSIIIDAFTKMFESNLGLIAIVFVVAIVAYFFRHDIAYDFDFNKREKNKFTAKALLIPIIIAVAAIGYLYIKEHYFLLSLILSIVSIYFLFWIGFLNMVVEKLEDLYGRQ